MKGFCLLICYEAILCQSIDSTLQIISSTAGSGFIGDGAIRDPFLVANPFNDKA